MASVVILAAACGTIAAVLVARAGLTLSHYDARGHLVVARRIVDSLTPGWQQIGAVWLPLPHLLNAIPAQIDPLYQTGAPAVVSVASFALAAGAIAWIVYASPGALAGRGRGVRVRGQSEPALPAEHADDRAVDARLDAGRRGDARRVVRGGGSGS